MKRHAPILAALALATAATPALADEALAKKHSCNACHAMDKKMVGPAYKDVAAKYRGDAKAEAMLAEKVKKGGVGNWGQVPMPPNAALKDDEAKTLVKWVLSLK